ncbi:hypothetical protein ACFPFV_02415 [Salinicoccus siamensis]
MRQTSTTNDVRHYTRCSAILKAFGYPSPVRHPMYPAPYRPTPRPLQVPV